MKQQTKTLLVWLVLIVIVLGLAHVFNTSQEVTPRTYAEFVSDVNRGDFRDVVLVVETHKAHVEIEYE